MKRVARASKERPDVLVYGSGESSDTPLRVWLRLAMPLLSVDGGEPSPSCRVQMAAQKEATPASVRLSESTRDHNREYVTSESGTTTETT